MANSLDSEANPLGHTVVDFLVIGEEVDGTQRRVGADVLVDIMPVGRFFLRIVTKDQYASDTIVEAVFSSESLEKLLNNSPDVPVRPPYVLNDTELSDEVLARKLKNRLVEQDFAAALSYQGPAA